MRYIVFVLLVCFGLYGENGQKKIEIFATEFKSKGDILYLSNGVTIVYGDYILNSKRAKYDKNTKILELFGNIKVTSHNKYKILGKYAKLDLKNKTREFKPFFMLERESDVWLSSECSNIDKKYIDIDSGVVSGCDPIDPLWQIEFSSSSYHRDTKWLNLYNAVLYIYDIPVFYTPYFGYSLDKTRRTGLLPPGLGISNDEGLYYQQPIYIAEQNWWDLELNPQIRTLRGKGVYSTFRFVDSKYSKGYIKAGYFKENGTYYIKHDLKNKSHYGFNIKYENIDLVKSWFDKDLDAQTALYLDVNHMNDVDYINLAKNDVTKTVTSNQVLSRINLFYNSVDNYVGVYGNYYIDLSKSDNTKTLQKLPTLQYHRYMDTLLGNYLIYNFDLKSTNLYRKNGTNAIQTNLSIPITIQSKIFDEYVTLAYSSNLFGQYTKFIDNNTTYLKNGYYARSINSFVVSSQLTKPYKNFVHTLNFSASYITKGFNKTSGYYETNKDLCFEHPSSDECEFYNIADIKEALFLNFSQYVYDKDNSQRLYHRLSQIIVDYNKQTQDIGELENELEFKITSNLDYYNNTFYNYSNKNISKTLNKLTYNNYGFSISLSHFFKNSFDENPNTSYITSSFNYRFNSHYSYMASFDYDLIQKTKKQAQIGFLYDKRCWQFGLRYAENNRPILTNNEAKSIYDRYIYITILLKPIMKAGSSSNFGFRLPSTLTN